MKVEAALLFCLIVFVVLVIIFYSLGCLRLRSAIPLAAVFSLILLLFVFPPILLICQAPTAGCFIYPSLVIIALVIVVVYVVWAACRDRCKHHQW